MPLPALFRRHRRQARLAFGAVVVASTLLAGSYFLQSAGAPGNDERSHLAEPPRASDVPWVHGRQGDARFVATVYADLECPHCKTYVPALKSWIDRHPQVELHWSHLPLAFHEPAATRLAVTAECMGRAGGQVAFWNTVAWIFQSTNGDGRGLPEDVTVPGVTSAVEACIGSEEPREVVQAQARLAAQEGIYATPTLKLEDRAAGKQLVLSGAVEDDALLSALDLLSSEEGGVLTNDLPAGVAGMPR